MRPKKIRNLCCDITGERLFAPKCMEGEKIDYVHLTLDEFEAIRMCDRENMKQEDVAEIMNVHRTTVSRILTSAHQKIADALINLKEIRISGDCCTYKNKEEKK
ncbi:MAG: DUF134 domain-containing protein [Candidatus Margulisbacteria bacterium]|nr:DUF134 domain-containing protein [Candidatus Margulisiibacteriota bacterium]